MSILSKVLVGPLEILTKEEWATLLESPYEKLQPCCEIITEFRLHLGYVYDHGLDFQSAYDLVEIWNNVAKMHDMNYSTPIATIINLIIQKYPYMKVLPV